MHKSIISPKNTNLWLKTIFFSLLLFFHLSTQANTTNISHSSYSEQVINNDWLYLEKDSIDITLIKQAKNWQPISIPHSWNKTDTIDSVPGYRRSGSWYKRNLTLDKKNFAHTVLFFEGANFETQLYVNGNFVGEHIGGYLAFEFDISQFIQQGDNEILVRVSNAYNKNLIPSQKADFFLHGGITRDVWLKQYPDVYLKNLVVNTPNVSKKSASTSIQLTTNIKQNSSSYKAVASLYSPSNILIEQKETSLNAEQSFSIDFTNLSNPKLWSPDHPNLYSVEGK